MAKASKKPVKADSEVPKEAHRALEDPFEGTSRWYKPRDEKEAAKFNQRRFREQCPKCGEQYGDPAEYDDGFVLYAGPREGGVCFKCGVWWSWWDSHEDYEAFIKFRETWNKPTPPKVVAARRKYRQIGKGLIGIGGVDYFEWQLDKGCCPGCGIEIPMGKYAPGVGYRDEKRGVCDACEARWDVAEAREAIKNTRASKEYYRMKHPESLYEY